jgi:hypothetical protein
VSSIFFPAHRIENSARKSDKAQPPGCDSRESASVCRTEARIATARGYSVTASFPGERSERENRGCPLDSHLVVYTIICKEGSDER